MSSRCFIATCRRILYVVIVWPSFSGFDGQSTCLPYAVWAFCRSSQRQCYAVLLLCLLAVVVPLWGICFGSSSSWVSLISFWHTECKSMKNISNTHASLLFCVGDQKCSKCLGQRQGHSYLYTSPVMARPHPFCSSCFIKADFFLCNCTIF